jgi:hypothetical protein
MGGSVCNIQGWAISIGASYCYRGDHEPGAYRREMATLDDVRAGFWLGEELLGSAAASVGR